MTDDATIIVDTEPSATVAAPAATPPTIPGVPAQTQATITRLKADPELAQYIVRELGYDTSGPEALALARKIELRSTTFEAALKYGIPEDKLPLISDATPEGIMQRAAALAPLLKQTPQDATPPADTAIGATPPAKSAGIPLPPVAPVSKIAPTGVKDALVEMFTANPLPKPEQ